MPRTANKERLNAKDIQFLREHIDSLKQQAKTAKTNGRDTTDLDVNIEIYSNVLKNHLTVS